MCHAADGFVNVDKHVGFVNDFPVFVSSDLGFERLHYLLSNQFFDNIFERDDTHGAAGLSWEFGD